MGIYAEMISKGAHFPEVSLGQLGEGTGRGGERRRVQKGEKGAERMDREKRVERKGEAGRKLGRGSGKGVGVGNSPAWFQEL